LLGDALFVARKDLQHALRLPQVWVWMLAMPVLLSWLVGSLMQSMAGHIDRIDIYAPPSSGFLADDLVRRLAASGFQVARAANRAELASAPLSLAIPEDFTHSVLAGPPAAVELAYPTGYRFAPYDTYRVGRALDEMLGDLVVLSKRGSAPDAVHLAALTGTPSKLQLRVESAGKARRLILGFQQTVPGFIVMFTLQVSLTTGSVLLIAERRQGILRRLASTPVGRASLVFGKLGARLAMGLIQVAIAMLFGKYFFGVDWGGSNLGIVLLLLTAYTALCAALAIAFASVAHSESQALAAGVIVSCVLAALGGCWWPVEVTPTWMQHVAVLLPTGWAMDGLHKLISYGDSPASVLPHLLALTAATAAVTWIAVRRFRFQ
jgi:ABC-type multidrug transport system permease subunit